MGKVLWQTWVDDHLDNVLNSIKQRLHNNGVLKTVNKAPFLIHIIEYFTDDYVKFLSELAKTPEMSSNREFLESVIKILNEYKQYKDEKAREEEQWKIGK